jgi:translation initiation factor 1 (eIF-1/SUI1)
MGKVDKRNQRKERNFDDHVISVVSSESSEPTESSLSSSSSTEEEKPIKKKPAVAPAKVTKAPPKKQSAKKVSSESESSSSESESSSSESSSSESSEEEEEVPVVKPQTPVAAPKSSKVTISDRKCKKTGVLITSVVNIPDDMDLARLARALGKVYKCKTRVRTRDGVPTIELKGQHKRDAREFLTKVKIVELRQINMI